MLTYFIAPTRVTNRNPKFVDINKKPLARYKDKNLF